MAHAAAGMFHINTHQKIYECRLMTSPKIEFTTLADEPLSAKYRPAHSKLRRRRIDGF